MTNQKTDPTPYPTLKGKSEGLMGARNAPPPHPLIKVQVELKGQKQGG